MTSTFRTRLSLPSASASQALADRIVESGMKITWAATMRADQGVRLPDEVWARCKQSGLRRLLVGVESGSNEMLKRIRKDIKIEQVFETAEKMLKYDIAGHFPFIVGFPDESDASIQATLDCAKKLRSLSPDFLTPIYYFKPYPGSELVIEAVARGFRLPRDARGLGGIRLRGRNARALGVAGEVQAHRALQVLPRACLEADVARQAAAAAARALSLQPTDYRWPVEMLLTRWVLPAQKLS